MSTQHFPHPASQLHRSTHRDTFHCRSCLEVPVHRQESHHPRKCRHHLLVKSCRQTFDPFSLLLHLHLLLILLQTPLPPLLPPPPRQLNLQLSVPPLSTTLSFLLQSSVVLDLLHFQIHQTQFNHCFDS